MPDRLDPAAAAALLQERLGAVSAPAEADAPPTAPAATQARLVATQPSTTPAPSLVVNGGYRYLRPFVEAADEFTRQAKTLTTGERVYTGIDVFDQAMRGLARKELMIVQGYAHSGKTVFTTQMMEHNKERPMVLFTPDESKVLILTKLTSLVHGVSAEELEYRIADGDTDAERLVRSTALDHFPNLIVFDDVSELNRMTRALDECRQHFGEQEAFVIFDYAKLLQYEGDEPAKIDAIKGWAKDQNAAMVLLHQSSRTRGSDGAEVTIDSGSHGGEQQATFVVGVRRKKSMWKGILRDLRKKKAEQIKPSEALDEKIAEAEYELIAHAETVTVNLVKNKRPPGHLVDDTDFTLDKDTGRMLPCEQPFTSTSPMRARQGIQVPRRARFGQTTIEGGEEPF